MARPQCCRRIGKEPPCGVFKPEGMPDGSLEEVVLSLDEFEALRLADLEGLYQEQAAASMNVSRQTFGRIIDGARRKTAQALILGRVLRIAGGVVEKPETRRFECPDCQHSWELCCVGECPQGCPNCKSTTFCIENLTGRGCGAGHSPENGHGRKRCCHRRGLSAQNL